MDKNEQKVCCFTGHRSQTLPWKFSEEGMRFSIFKINLLLAIKKSINEGYTHFISGMGLGVDLIAAELILALKKQNENITLECALPCQEQEKMWDLKSKKRYYIILEQADIITKVSDCRYFNGCMKKRNQYMINKSSKIIAVFSGMAGGTEQTISMAKEKGIDLIEIVP